MAYIYVRPESPVRSHLLFFRCNRGSRHSPIRQILHLTLRLDFMDTQKFSSDLPSPHTSPSRLLGKALENLGGEIIYVANLKQGPLHKLVGQVIISKSLLAKLGIPSFKSKVCTSFLPLMSLELSSTIPTGSCFEGSDSCRPRILTQ